MKISYNQATDSPYIRLADRASADSDEATSGVVLDFDINGAAVGIDGNRPVNEGASTTRRRNACASKRKTSCKSDGPATPSCS